MNANQLVNMVVRLVVRKLVSKGINAGVDAVGSRTNGGKNDDKKVTGADSSKRMKQTMKMMRRLR